MAGGNGGSDNAGGTDGNAGASSVEPFVCPDTIEPSGYCFADVTAGEAGYQTPPEAIGPIGGAPAGQLLESTLASPAYGETFPYAVYIPAQYDGSTPATLTMVQDMVHYLSRTEATFNTTQVLDNLIHAGEIPVTIAVFHEPATCTIPQGQPQSYCRDVVYNRASSAYAEFVVNELIPHVVTTHGVSISDDPSKWLSVGFSAGGAAALGLAFHRPDKFQRVITHSGSFVPAATRIGDATGSEIYISGLDAAEPRPLRVTLSGSPNDLSNEFGNWLMVNQSMARILDDKGNHYRFTVGDGVHYPPLQGAAVFPDDLRFIWADLVE
jgi:enterochelin esterase family protein